jgi:LmbE family N-acetylglucosaminyl deacetylase
MGKRVIVVSAHPDDEILGVGGTLIRHRDLGDKVTWVIVTSLFRKQGFSEDRIRSRKEEIVKVAERLRFDSVVQFEYPTMTLTPADLVTLIPKISDVLNEVKPSRIYVMNRSDAHSDHRVVFDAVAACSKSFRYPYLREIFMYECISETEFAPALFEKVYIPNCFIDISDHLQEKIDLMKIYFSEMGEHPFPRSEENIRALATFRGASCGVKYAESFQLIKSLRIEEL